MGIQNDNEEDVIVTLEMEDGEKVDCIVVTIFEVKGKEYAVLMPEDEKDEEEPEIVFYRYIEEGEDGILEAIESDEEYDIVEDAFDEFLDTIEFSQMK
ncbi:MAG: DUF1292 domain-containing protein [Clostridiales bacterium]|nr:DUF1292 domain-containing protein [Candidatus Blautia equi]